MEGAAMVVTVSDYTAKFLIGRFPDEARKVKRVYNGLDLKPFAEARGAEKGDPPILLSVGRLIEKKGFDDLIRSCAKMRESGDGGVPLRDRRRRRRWRLSCQRSSQTWGSADLVEHGWGKESAGDCRTVGERADIRPAMCDREGWRQGQPADSDHGGDGGGLALRLDEC